MPDAILLSLVLGLFTGIVALQGIALLGIWWVLQHLEVLARQGIQPATDDELAEAAVIMSRIDPSHPWRDIIHQERRRP